MSAISYSTLIPYLFGGVFLLALGLIRGWDLYDRKTDRILSLALILLAAWAAGSADLGTDVLSYREYYAHLSGATEYYGWWEPGFAQLARFFATMGAPYGLFVFVCVLVSHLIKFYVFDRTTENVLLALFVLFCFDLGEIAFVREYLAASLIFLSFYLLTRHRNALAALAIVAAALFHKSALIAGVVILITYFGRRSVKPLVLLAFFAGACVLLMPSSLLSAIEARVFTQFAAYTVEGFVQGVQGVVSAETSLIRNYVKFGLYVLIALWMAILPARAPADSVQRKSMHVVIALSVVSVVLIAAISPIFTRISTYVFPFIALGMRAEQFRPTYARLVGQSVLAALLGANLVIAIYPLAAYL